MIFSSVEPILKDSYLAFVKNSVSSKSFRNLYVKVSGRKKDILEGGNLSCAFFVSAVLLIFDLIEKTHATVKGTLADMESNGWFEIKEFKKGSVLVWEQKQKGGTGGHFHVGFFIGGHQAISNSSKKQTPQTHHLTFGKNKNGQPGRPIVQILWHDKLDD